MVVLLFHLIYQDSYFSLKGYAIQEFSKLYSFMFNLYPTIFRDVL